MVRTLTTSVKNELTSGQIRPVHLIEIGFSTHESPLEKSLAPVAVSLGCTIIEKHVGVKTDQISLNGYSNTPEQMEEQILLQVFDYKMQKL